MEPLKFTLRSAAETISASGEKGEIIVVDDGSSPLLAEALAGFSFARTASFFRQNNSGSIIARLSGLRRAHGEFVTFLDSDDLFHPDKVRLHLAALRTANADVSHDDRATAELGANYQASFASGQTVPHSSDPAEFYLRVQPLPHSPVYRRDYLLRALADPIVPPDREMDSAGDVCLYYNLAPWPARIVKVDASLSAIGPHEETRYSQHWESLGVAALRVAEAFIDRCPDRPDTMAARTIAGEIAFDSWRRLPKDFHPAYEARLLQVWRRAPKGSNRKLGGRGFSAIAGLVGPVVAGRLLRQLRNGSYASCRTLTAEQYDRLFASL